MSYEAAIKAKAYCQEVINADIEKIESLPLAENSFDYIICLDILEHLIRPDLVLLRLMPYLSPRGKFIISIPNIARIEYRIKLFFGNFDYSDSGALSSAHLRFFSLKTARDLLESSGLKIKRIEPTGLGSILRIFPALFAFQFLFVAEK